MSIGGISLLPWIILGCFSILVGYFAPEIKQRLVVLWYSLAIRFLLWRAGRELGNALRDLSRGGEDE